MVKKSRMRQSLKTFLGYWWTRKPPIFSHNLRIKSTQKSRRMELKGEKRGRQNLPLTADHHHVQRSHQGLLHVSDHCLVHNPPMVGSKYKSPQYCHTGVRRCHSYQSVLDHTLQKAKRGFQRKARQCWCNQEGIGRNSKESKWGIARPTVKERTCLTGRTCLLQEKMKTTHGT